MWTDLEATGNTAHREHSPQGTQPTGTAHREHSPQGAQPTGNTAHREHSPQGQPTGNTAHREHSPEGAQPRGSLNFEPYKPLVISNTKQLLVQNIVSYGSFDLHTFIVLQRGIPITGARRSIFVLLEWYFNTLFNSVAGVAGELKTIEKFKLPALKREVSTAVI